jgi:hypothetical protein
MFWKEPGAMLLLFKITKQTRKNPGNLLNLLNHILRHNCLAIDVCLQKLSVRKLAVIEKPLQSKNK